MPKILGPITDKGGAAREFNIRDYGAKGDGSTNDGPAFQAALDAAVSAGGGTVFCPAGTYAIASNVKILGSNITIKSDPKATFLRTSNSIAFLQNGKTDGTDANGGYTGNGNLVVDGGTWNMNATVYTTNQGCFGFGHADGITVRNVIIKDVPMLHAIEFNACKNVLVENCRFLGYRWDGTGGFAFEEAIQIDLAKSGAFNIAPYDLTGCQDVRIVNNYFGASGTAGTQAWPCAFGSHLSVIGRPHKRILFQGNTVEGATFMGVRGYNWDNVQINANKFITCESAVKLCNVNTTETANSVDDNGNVTTAAQHLYNFQVTNNLMKNLGGTTVDGTNAGHGVYIIGYGTDRRLKGVTVSGNQLDTQTVKVTNTAGMYVGGIDNLNFTGNALISTSGRGVTVNSVNQGSITGNVLNDVPSGDGFKVDSSSDLTVSGNILRDIWNWGMNFTSCVNLTITGNTVRWWGKVGTSGWAAVLLQGFNSVATNIAHVTGNNFVQEAATTKYGIKVRVDGTNAATNILVGTNYADVPKSTGNADANGNWLTATS